jgi:hypothetical protein
MAILLPPSLTNTENGQDKHNVPGWRKMVFSIPDIQLGHYQGWNKLNGLTLGSNKIKHKIFNTHLSVVEFPAWDKLKCPGVTQNPEWAKSFNMTKH